VKPLQALLGDGGEGEMHGREYKPVSTRSDWRAPIPLFSGLRTNVFKDKNARRAADLGGVYPSFEQELARVTALVSPLWTARINACAACSWAVLLMMFPLPLSCLRWDAGGTRGGSISGRATPA
jgi:hypothetical protein